MFAHNHFRAESRFCPRQGQRLERDRDCGNLAAPHECGAVAASAAVREGIEEKPEQRGREGGAATGAERFPGGGSSPTHPGRAPGSLSCRSALG